MSFIINPFIFGDDGIPRENLVFYLACENTAADSVGNFTGGNAPSNNGITFNNIDVKSGTRYGVWNSNTDNISVPDDDLLSFGDSSTDSPFSISFWIYVTNTGNNPRLYDKRGAGGDEYRVVMVSGKVRLVLTDDSTGGTIYKIQGSTLTTNTWYQLTFTYDGSGNSSGITIYLNGSDDGGTTGSSGSYTAMENGTSNLIIGKDNALTANTVEGRMDSMALWNIELSSDHASAIYNELNAGNELL